MKESLPSPASAVVLFGATGDLALRMLFPALYFLHRDGFLPEGLPILCAARAPLDDQGFAALAAERVRATAKAAFDAPAWESFAARLRYRRVDAEQPESFARLKPALGEAGAAPLFFFSTSPSLYARLCAGLMAAGLVTPASRIVLEKPIGRDLASSRAINAAVGAAFSEDRVFRIDHYLGKETVQNLFALRFANVLFEPLWSSQTIEHVQITVAETVGVEGRHSYYDEYGALRDMVQNHVLQLLCLVAMEAPAHFDPDSVRNEKVKVLRSLRPITQAEIDIKTVRGQYGPGVVEGAPVRGYAEEEGAGDSLAETYVALCAHVDNWRWAGVPFYLRTGKRLPERRTEIVIQFRAVPHSVFARDAGLAANRLVISLQPTESVSLTLMNKAPGLGGMELAPLALNLSLDDAFASQRRRIAYERLFLDALNGNPTLFVRRDEVEAAWAWIDAIEEAWARAGAKPRPYAAGAWGPAGAFALTERNGHTWLE